MSGWRVGSWKIRLLLNSEGPVETARQGRVVAEVEDRRSDLCCEGTDEVQHDGCSIARDKVIRKQCVQSRREHYAGSGPPCSRLWRTFEAR